MKIASTVALLAASASAIHVRSASNAHVSVWGQCGGKNHSSDTTCATGSYCKVINEWYSQCQPGGNGQVGVWAQCGGKDYKGDTTCTAGNTCKAWNTDYSQCVPSDNDGKKDNTSGALPAGWLELPGLKWTLLDNDLATTDDKSFADCVQSGTKPATDGMTRFFAVWDSTKKVCHVASTNLPPHCPNSATSVDSSRGWHCDTISLRRMQWCPGTHVESPTKSTPPHWPHASTSCMTAWAQVGE
ncbi:hypothetical protein SPRG_21685 [Saprolegnia parasitica CBS 223.65]|uniref:CBM1 domain-containing protein n=1 Tax=Saprolegnia parasitica (strain CBS 223.65) TaxID=695850 RepID=A0A067BP70_SAPPC|nr:hypothetical protein SPRG_21685 [Saprolegnia parasitica CBS 223.65]KDO18555.1 hypothetical protein SPRG_21685 [Saprolegnia parasitica CBS 223.65]|eukprot:XP_012210743.1 hypothetical protein SPRG_21685 [Saprolegnia parasitica CBS 223.65]